jgi:hydrogenase maturation protease
MRTLILCVGNASSSDDGIGARIGQVLQSLPLPGDIQVDVVSRFRIELPDRLAEVDHLVIVDGLTAEAEPGTCTVVDVTGHPAAVVASGCCHSREVADIIQLAREVAPEGEDCAITIGGVRVEHLDRNGGAFSSAVLLAVPRIVDLLLLTTGAGLKPRLLAAESLRQSERPAREPSAFYARREVCPQGIGLQ